MEKLHKFRDAAGIFPFPMCTKSECIEGFHSQMQIYYDKGKRLHKKKDQLPQDWFGTPIWPPFHCFWTSTWRM